MFWLPLMLRIDTPEDRQLVLRVGGAMELSTAQMWAIENGEAVAITVGHTKCMLIREDLYELVKAVLDIEDAYPLLDETFREGWDAPGMADYDRYDELKHR
jgi:hypothetical protein